MDAIRWEGNTLYLLDQTKLPVTEVWLPYTDYRPVADAIRTMVVRGAPAIGVTAAYAYCLAALAGEGLGEAKETLAASLMAKGKIDLAVVGCDRMAANGDFANKIGTYSVAVNAHYHGIPFYVALPCSTIDLSLADGSGIPIEERDRDEVRTLYGTRTAPESVEVCNPAFDVTPHSLVTGIITEKGVIYPPFQENLQKLFG